jgi:hypothetical protein
MILQIHVPQEFFTVQSMLTLTGATGATFIVANAFQMALNFNPKWFALLIAIIIALFGVYQSHNVDEPHLFSDYFVGTINGFLIYCTTAGGTQILGQRNSPEATHRGVGPDPIKKGSVSKRKFLTPWFS